MPGAGGESPRRLCVYTAGFLRQRRLRRILALAGWRVSLGLPGGTDHVGVWGQSPYSKRGESIAARRGAPLLRIEDAFVRSLHPGRDREPPIGLLLDRTGVHFDGRAPSDLETLLATHPLDDHALLERARGAIARMREGHLTKYAAVDPTLPAPDPGYVLVVDQTAGDASVIASGADRTRFREMLYWAQEEHPGKRILIRTHPETTAGHRKGHFRTGDAGGRIALHADPVSPWVLLDGAVAVYTVSSQMGFEAILAGHRPRVFGTPFYAGWGLTDAETPIARRARPLTRNQLFAAAMILYPTWYDPCRDRLCRLEDALAQIEAQARAWREDRHGWVATGMRMWKRGHLQRFFGAQKPLIFAADAAQARARADVAPESGKAPRRIMAWATTATDAQAVRVEDGFLRSRGLGAELVPPLSLVCDPMGIYYDPTRPSTLEKLIADAPLLRDDALARAEILATRLVSLGLTKYNLAGLLPPLPDGHRILVPGQVEDDASIRLGSPHMTRNADLLDRVRADNPTAVILWKPHPDVVAGLRPGAVDTPGRWADLTVTGDMAALLGAVDEVWTMTSLAGFEALLRGVRVTTLGAPFYAGWGLTRDLGPVPARRLPGPRPTLAGLVHATLIAYPRYRDPVTGLPCPPEVIVDRLAADPARRGAVNRSLSKLQGLFASRAHLWRR
ncbi:capsular biosynthesis protein [Salipiger aestuarii]|uniref:Capsular polysaccharide export protein n=1 Tax=Salipiger aestuarii TaxID=568098 RepID=A0A327YWT6_9RHOB|nr:capsular polysaccharide biosynthesis protein [Salipiger aestuarii]EIE49464.1 capsular polysaccharide export protein KpsC [Citreicella sp. 357]KAA8610066.1 capsular biosynthesis protein [Salipiger aestuarii]KAB2540820.1 capsular biosynthesis protein [Salipiger aestuarii]RAK24145.1 capsular polysaccharide export protein [Salipiger aestuarii]